MVDFWFVTHDAFWSAVAAVGFAIIFNVPRRALLGCALVGAIGHALRTVSVELGLTLEIGTLLGATAAGFISQGFARFWRTPFILFAVPGIIPMVPGTFAYRTMIGLLDIVNMDRLGGDSLLVETSINAAKTALILAALALGTIAPNLLFRRHRPVV